MADIIFINGAFGAGKTQTTYELARRLRNVHIFDPEEAGYYIRRCLPDSMKYSNFQDHPEWRSINNQMLRSFVDYDGIILAPMTIIRTDYWHEITDNVPVKRHIVLNLSKDELRRRQHKRFEGKNSFAAQMANECIAAYERFPTEIPDALLLDCDKLSISETAERIADECGLSLSPRFNPISSMIYRIRVTTGHIR
ncbi:MAG: tunicamycin resistance protein [Clostridiales bacterium]|nr:tunicamycin resistance protein [Clostridiales bacterium]